MFDAQRSLRSVKLSFTFFSFINSAMKFKKKKKSHTLTGTDCSVLFGVCFRGSQAIHVNLKADATLPFTYFVVTMYMQSFKLRKLLYATKKKAIIRQNRVAYELTVFLMSNLP